MPEFEIGQKVRFWSFEDCVEWAKMHSHPLDEEGLKKLPYWDQIMTITQSGQVNINIETPQGQKLIVAPVCLYADLRTEQQLAIEILGEEYFG